MALTISSGSRAIIPALGTSVYAAGVRSGLVDGHFGFLVLILWALLLNFACFRLPDAAAGNPLQATPNDLGERDDRA